MPDCTPSRKSRQQDTAWEIGATYQAHDLNLPERHIMPEFNEYSSRDIIMAHIRDVAQEDPGLKADLKRLYVDKKAFQRVFETIMVRWISMFPASGAWHPKT